MRYNEFLNNCYDLYKMDWCLVRNVAVEDVDEEIGINGGECFVSLEEFEGCEFKDKDYMKALLSNSNYGLWEGFFPIEKKDIIRNLFEGFPDRAVSISKELLDDCITYFESTFEIDTKNNCCCGSLGELNNLLGRDYRYSELLFDIADVFSREYDPELWHPQDCWEYSIKKVIGDELYEKVFNESLDADGISPPFNKFRVVLTCFDPDVKPYADCDDELFFDKSEAYIKARAMATEECASLNGENDGVGPEVGIFEVDDCANNDFEVRWYEKKPEERDEGSCDIEYVTTYNVYPIEFTGAEVSSCKYRGFEINPDGALYNVSKDGIVFGGGDSFLDALMVADDLCLECAKDKTYALEAVHKVPLEVVIKFASERQINEKSAVYEVERIAGER